jgi:hypothetical protein
MNPYAIAWQLSGIPYRERCSLVGPHGPFREWHLDNRDRFGWLFSEVDADGVNLPEWAIPGSIIIRNGVRCRVVGARSSGLCTSWAIFTDNRPDVLTIWF